MADPHGPSLLSTPTRSGSQHVSLCCGKWRDKGDLTMPGSIDIDPASLSGGRSYPQGDLVTQEMLTMLNQILVVLPDLADKITHDILESQNEIEKRLQGKLDAMESRLQMPWLPQESWPAADKEANTCVFDPPERKDLAVVVAPAQGEGDTAPGDGKETKGTSLATAVAVDASAEGKQEDELKRSESSHRSASSGNLKPLRHEFMTIFNELDLNKEGSLDRSEIDHFLNAMGLPQGAAKKAFAEFDKDADGKIGRSEWLHLIQHFEEHQADPELATFLAAMTDRFRELGCIYEQAVTSTCILHHDSHYRICWDVLTLFLLAYIALSLPMSLAYGIDINLRIPDTIIDFLFMFDVALNFRTTYINSTCERVVSGRSIARHYLKGWFLLDFVSSIPFDLLSTGVIPGLQPLKVVKVSKLGKVLKVLRFTKMLKIIQGSAFAQDIEEFVWSNHCGKVVKFTRLLVMLIAAGHWLACLLISVRGGSLDAYLEGAGQEVTNYQKYLAAMYWAMMTLSTVGYGDISMRTSEERTLAIIAMMLGGSFYAYLVGSITALVADNDLNSRAYRDRMNLVEAWLDFHEELPSKLRRRIWIHFKEHLAKRTAVEDSIVMNDLPTNLKHILSGYLLHDNVRYNQLFDGLPPGEFPGLVLVVQHTARAVEENICFRGERGHAMFIVHKGIARKIDENDKISKVSAGESFGEEILLELTNEYSYTVVAESKCALLKIPKELFAERFAGRLDLLDKMRSNYENTHVKIGSRSGTAGSSSVLEGGQTGIPPSFPDTVIQHLDELMNKMNLLVTHTQRSPVAGPRPQQGHIWQNQQKKW